jgi:hypothetical protein
MPKFGRLVHFQLTEVVVIILTVNGSPARYFGVVQSMSAGYYTLNVATYIGLYLYICVLLCIMYISILTKKFNNMYIFMLLLINFGLSDRELRMGRYESSYFLVGYLGGSS